MLLVFNRRHRTLVLVATTTSVAGTNFLQQVRKMFDTNTLFALTKILSGVGGNPDQETIVTAQDIIDHVTKNLKSYNFIDLANELAQIGISFSVPWQKSYWIFADGTDDGTVLTMYYKHEQGNNEAIVVRSIKQEGGSLVAYHDYLELSDSLQQGGLSRAINNAMYQAYIALGVKSIKVHANLIAGGYVWARVGFSATQEDELTDILDEAEERVNNGETTDLTLPLIQAFRREVESHYKQSQDPFPIYEWATNIQSNYPKELLLGSSWHGELNLEDQDSVSIFRTYLSKKP